MKHLDLFSGIGGFALATEMVWPNVEHTFCDNEPFSQAILKKHWPGSKIYDDIRTITDPGPADLVTGGFPCQPFSTAGKRRGTQDDRHLWPEMLRVIRLSAPRWVIGENVGGLLTWDRGLVLERVLVDLEDAGYEAWPFVLPACSKNAPHRRDRIWIIAHANRDLIQERRATGENARAATASRLQQRDAMERIGESNTIRVSSNTASSRRREGDTQRDGISERGDLLEKQKYARGGLADSDRDTWNNWPEAVARLCSMDDGLPGGLVRPRGWRNAALKGAGNAIVPQVAAQIMLAINEVDPW